MKYEPVGEQPLSTAPVRYGSSKILFRGPKRSLSGKYLAFVGGTETYGKFIERPFPALVEAELGVPCVNFGVANASVDVFLNEEVVMGACHDSAMNVIQVMGAHNLTNRFYSVHPRRNDRFVRARSVLQALYPEVDFADYCFTRHLLQDLYAISEDRFDIVRTELQQAWSARMRSFLAEIGAHTFLLWFSEQLPSDRIDSGANPFDTEPLFVTRRMIDGLRPLVQGVVTAQPTAHAIAQGTRGMLHRKEDAAAATEMLGVAAHQEAAQALCQAIRTRQS